MPKRAVIFDMDGVLVDSEPIHSQICRSLFRELGFDLTDERHHSFVGYSNRAMWTELRQEFRLAPSVDDLLDRGRQYVYAWFERLKDLPTVPGMQDLIWELAQRQLRMAIASSSSRELIELVVRKLGFQEYFPIMVSGDEVAHGKPAPDIFIMTAARLRVPPSECLVIEDSPHGVAGACAAGMACVGFTNPNSGNHDLSRAHLVVPDFSGESIAQIVKLLVR